MKFTATSTAFLTALAALAGTSFAASSCIRQDNFLYTYVVRVDNVPNISDVCGGLWDNLKYFAACVASEPSCGAVGPGNPLQWKFNVGAGCNGGMVESAWWEATHNKYGSISCPP
ncbi:MAG: hypothetical protein M1813_001814 [Trichoglossum hirsutum]|jgi:hypothetical protein|nr:MAG: hypothetical protein M1813_001814 [Trichoglossum hirsutum]